MNKKTFLAIAINNNTCIKFETNVKLTSFIKEEKFEIQADLWFLGLGK